MWTTALCLCFTSAISAAPLGSPFFSYLPQYESPRQSGPSAQGNNVPYAQPGFNAPVSMEIVFPQRYPSGPAGGRTGGPVYGGQAFIKYSIPKAPGRKSVEVYYPYDFGQQQQNFPNIPQMPPVTNLFPFNLPPQTVPQQPPQLFPFNLPPQTVPQQPPQVPPYQSVPPQPQDTLQPAQQEQQAQAGGTLP